MELTLKQKNVIYRRALLEIQLKKNHYCCPAIKFGYFIVTGEKYPNNEKEGDAIMELFPEFLAYKPKECQFSYWFSDAGDNAERKMILENCIKQTS